MKNDLQRNEANHASLQVSRRIRLQRVTDQHRAREIATAIVQHVAELPDRTSPDDWPEAMLVTADELLAIVCTHFADGAVLTQAPEWECGGCGHSPHAAVCFADGEVARPLVCDCTGQPEHDVVCQHGTAADVACRGCHSGFFPIGSGYEAGFDAGYSKGYSDGLEESSSDPRVERIEAGFKAMHAATNGEYSREDMIVMDALQAGRDFAVRLARRETHIQQLIEERDATKAK